MKAAVRIIRRLYNHISDLISKFPKATAVFNCTGFGARHLGRVEDKRVYPTKVCLPPKVSKGKKVGVRGNERTITRC